MVVPVYVLFTKIDLIAGFTEFFGDLKKSDRAAAVGRDAPPRHADKSDPAAIFETEFDVLIKRCTRARCKRLHEGAQPRGAREDLPVPARVRGHRSATSPSFIRRDLRGQRLPGHADLPRLLLHERHPGGPPARSRARAHGPGDGPAPAGARRRSRSLESKSFFLHDVFMNVVFPDADIAARSASEIRRQWLDARRDRDRRRVARGSWCASRAWSASFKNRAFLSTTQERVQAAQAINWNQAASKNLALLDPILERLAGGGSARRRGRPHAGWAG